MNEPETWPPASPLEKPLASLGSSLNMDLLGTTSPSATISQALGAAQDSAALESSLGCSAPL